MRRRYDHIDLRVRSLAEARSFYEVLLPALGFTRNVRVEGWLQFEAAGADGASRSQQDIPPMNAGLPSGQTVRAKSTGWLRLSSGQALGMSKALDTMKGRAITRSFSRIPAAIGWKFAIERKAHDEGKDCLILLIARKCSMFSFLIDHL